MQQAFTGYLLNAGWQIPIVAVCAYTIARFAGLSPRERNRLWLLSLGLATLLPAVSLNAWLPRMAPTVARIPADALVDAAKLAAIRPAPALDPMVALPSWAIWSMTAAVTLAVLGLIIRLAAASIAARRLVRESSPVALPPEIIDAVGQLARRHGHAIPPIHSSAGVSSPAVVGTFHPVILLPEGMVPAGQDLQAALLHEMAHVVRRDYAINLACEVLTLPVGWHPALLGIKAGVRHSRELACDAMASQAMTSPKAYARCLVSLAQTLGAASNAPVRAALAVGLFGQSDLEDRLMQLMKPRDIEAPAIRAARLCGLAAVGASLLGSAALLHVTPLLAQPAAVHSPASAAPPAIATPAAIAEQARQDAGAAAPIPHRSGMIVSRKGVIIEAGQRGHHHSFTASDGHTMTVINDDPKDPSPEQQREWEATARDAEAKAAAAEKLVNSPEFKARIAKAEAQAAAAEKLVNSPEFKARIARAEAGAAAAEKLVNSPEFKARIAKAQTDGAAAEQLVNSPEFKARIESARAQAEAARKMVNSPEFKDRIAKARAEAEAARGEARRQTEELRALRDSHSAP